MSADSVRCPHCGHMYNRHMYDRHSPKCPLAPAMYARIRAALDDGTGAIRTSLAYRDDKANRADAVPPDYLYRFFETWEAVAEVYNLRWSPPVTGPRPGSKRDKPVKLWIRPLADEERLCNIPGEDYEALAYRSPYVQYGPCDMPVCRVEDVGREVVYVLR